MLCGRYVLRKKLNLDEYLDIQEGQTGWLDPRVAVKVMESEATARRKKSLESEVCVST